MCRCWTGPQLWARSYNAKCRSIVMRCEAEWKEVVPRMGRWIDFEGGYKTMDVRNNPLLSSPLGCPPGVVTRGRQPSPPLPLRFSLPLRQPCLFCSQPCPFCSALFCAMLCCAALCCAVQTTYMESVWWVFKTLFDKGLVYRGAKQSALSFPHPPDADGVWLSRACLTIVRS